MFELVKVDFDTMKKPLRKFYLQCLDEGSINNSSRRAMMVGAFEEEHWWAFMDKGKIFSISGCHRNNDFGPKGWRVLFRSATLKDYRGKAGPFSRDFKHDFCFGHLLEIQKKFVAKQGDQFMFFTTNSKDDGSHGSYRANRLVEKVLLKNGKVSLIKRNYFYFNCHQNIWKIE